MQTAKINKCSGLLMLVDFEKAFESISWQFQFETLSFSVIVIVYNLDKTFKQWY